MTRALAVAFAGGAWLMQQQPRLWTAAAWDGPWGTHWTGSEAWAALLTGMAIAALGAVRLQGAARLVCAVALAGAVGFVWAHDRAERRLADALAPAHEGRDLILVGVIRGLPYSVAGIAAPGIRFTFEVERTLTPGVEVPRHLSLSWYGRESDSSLPDLAPGERWRIVARLKRPHGSANPEGFDLERWLLEQNLRATGTVRAAEDANARLDAFVPSAGAFVDRARDRVARHIRAALAGAPYAGVIVALVVGEQRGIAAEEWTLFNRTGIGHLLSISGLHITMLAALAAALAARLWRRAARRGARWPLRVSVAQTAAMAGFVAAFAYTLMAGFAVPAQRTLWMLAIVAFALFAQRGFRPSHVLAAALAIVVTLDPWAVEAVGFWLSFAAVAALMYAGMGLERTVDAAKPSAWAVRMRASALEAARAQAAVTLALAPLTMLFFQQVSLVSPLANALAIPVVSFVVTPLALFGGIVGAVLGVAWPLRVAHEVFAWLALPLQALGSWPLAAVEWPAPSGWAVAAALLGLAWLAAPRGVPARSAGVALLLPLVLTRHALPPEGEFRALVFDVGQGTAVLVETAKHRLLYDAGPRYTDEADAGNRVVLPHLRAIGARGVDALVLSHRDQDHAGGARTLVNEREIGAVLAQFELDEEVRALAGEVGPCTAGRHWRWDGVDFEILHPPPGMPITRKHSNGASCVLRVGAGSHAVLLTGDIEAAQETDLVRHMSERLRADALLVPHHGSMSSSTAGFIAAVAPRVALIQAGYRNRFGHPRAEVLQRYAAAGTRIVRTDRDGAILLRVSPAGLVWSDWRGQRPRYWHDPRPGQG